MFLDNFFFLLLMRITRLTACSEILGIATNGSKICNSVTQVQV